MIVMQGIGRTVFLFVLALMATGMLASTACREESPAMKKANLGRALMERGQIEQAINTLKEAIRMDPELAMSHEHLGMAYEAAGMYPEAIAAFRETVRLDPLRDTAHTSIGCLILASHGSAADAEAALNKAFEINQTDSKQLACMGSVHLNRMNFEEAIEVSERAVSLNPQNVQAHLNLGIAYAETDRMERAKKAIETAISLNPDPQFAEQARAFLQSAEHPLVEGGPSDIEGGASGMEGGPEAHAAH